MFARDSMSFIPAKTLTKSACCRRSPVPTSRTPLRSLKWLKSGLSHFLPTSIFVSLHSTCKHLKRGGHSGILFSCLLAEFAATIQRSSLSSHKKMSDTSTEPNAPAKRPETRPHVVDPDDGPSTPFPICLQGEVVKGFGRGSSESMRLLNLMKY